MPNSELQQRIITALALLAATIGLLFFTSNQVFAGAMLIVLAIAAAEWFRLSELAPCHQWPWVVVSVAVAILLYTLSPPAWLIGALGTVLWLVVITLLWRDRNQLPTLRNVWIKRFEGVIVLSLFWFAVVAIHAAPSGAWLLLAGLLVVAAADSAAFFAGRRWGRRKLAVAISPGKSLEGLAGGLVGAAVLGALLLFMPGFEDVNPLWLIVISAITALFSVAGDLEESRLKREMNVKDSGSILPGHGGLLDRLDGQLAAMPVWLLGLSLLQLA
ncbi:MAG TPA: phosphatidate cytidylyltransferase [Halothiobacillaceae bacterium]|nr:phosphatidate cytidylyltransferase [Halothiobacillaceae bacterium]